VTEQLPLELGHRPALGRDDFLVSDSNADAVGWIDLWPDWRSPGLVIVGPPASGKSHLAQVWCARSGAASVGLAALAEPGAAARLAEYRCIVIDDADRGADERNLLHLYNLLAERGGSLLMTALEPPARWGLRLADLRSRLSALPVVAIRAPDDALIQAVLVKLFADRQLRVDPELVAYLSARLDRSLAVATNAVDILDRSALASRRALTIPFARDTLRAAGLMA
jgi:chromosomal replication initiation ATPase DnaA